MAVYVFAYQHERQPVVALEHMLHGPAHTSMALSACCMALLSTQLASRPLVPHGVAKICPPTLWNSSGLDFFFLLFTSLLPGSASSPSCAWASLRITPAWAASTRSSYSLTPTMCALCTLLTHGALPHHSPPKATCLRSKITNEAVAAQAMARSHHIGLRFFRYEFVSSSSRTHQAARDGCTV